MTVRFLISGEVQGVGYRYFVSRRAKDLHIAGWAKNLADGRVEVVAQGNAAALAQLEGVLMRGPPHARVDLVTRSDVSDEVIQCNAFNTI